MALPCRAECPSQSHPSHEPSLDFCPNLGQHMVSWDTSLPAATGRSSLLLVLGWKRQLLMTLRLLSLPDVLVVPKNPLHVSTTVELSPLTDWWREMLRSSGDLRHVGHPFPPGAHNSLIPKAGQTHGQCLSPGKKQSRAPWWGFCPGQGSLLPPVWDCHAPKSPWHSCHTQDTGEGSGQFRECLTLVDEGAKSAANHCVSEHTLP